MNEIEQHAHPEIIKVLVGNKCDLPREVQTEEAESFMNNNQFSLFFETSAKTGENVEEAFVQSAKLVLLKYFSSESFRQATRINNIQKVIEKKDRLNNYCQHTCETTKIKAKYLMPPKMTFQTNFPLFITRIDFYINIQQKQDMIGKNDLLNQTIFVQNFYVFQINQLISDRILELHNFENNLQFSEILNAAIFQGLVEQQISIIIIIIVCLFRLSYDVMSLSKSEKYLFPIIRQSYLDLILIRITPQSINKYKSNQTVQKNTSVLFASDCNFRRIGYDILALRRRYNFFYRSIVNQLFDDS